MAYSNVDLARDYANYLVTERMFRQIAEEKMALPLNEILQSYSLARDALRSIKENADTPVQRELDVHNLAGTLESLASKIIVGTKFKRG